MKKCLPLTVQQIFKTNQYSCYCQFLGRIFYYAHGAAMRHNRLSIGRVCCVWESSIFLNKDSQRICVVPEAVSRLISCCSLANCVRSGGGGRRQLRGGGQWQSFNVLQPPRILYYAAWLGAERAPLASQAQEWRQFRRAAAGGAKNRPIRGAQEWITPEIKFPGGARPNK